MRLKRFFMETAGREGASVEITGGEARHMTTVLRLGRGDRIIVLDPSGQSFQARIFDTRPAQVSVVLETRIPSVDASPVHITLAQALIKSQAMDQLIRGVSELGIHRIIPLHTRRTVVTLRGDRAEKKLRRWNAIARSAAKQCRRAVPLRIDPPMDLTDLISQWEDKESCKLILWEGEETRDLKDVTREGTPPGSCTALVGPEGGFAIREIEAARARGFCAISLGPRILRTETAALALAALLQYEWGDLSLAEIHSNP